MPDASQTSQQLMTELQVSAHLMQLDAGVYCVSHAPGSAPPDPKTGLPGARLSVPPGPAGQHVVISGFRDDGWLGALDSAALIRVSQGPAQVLMTIYQAPNSQHEPPRLQVTRLTTGAASEPAAQSRPPQALEADTAETEIAAHIQQRGDLRGKLGEWVGERGSQRWIEGFSLAPRQSGIPLEDMEYQAVLGRGWLSPWAEGSQYCGSRGMALPILGLRVRLRGKSAQTHTVKVSATFTDGTAVGPVGAGDACEAESLAPLEAFCVTITANPASAARKAALPVPAAAKAKPVSATPKPKAKAAPAAPPKPVKVAAKKAAPPPAPKRAAPPPKGKAKPAPMVKRRGR